MGHCKFSFTECIYFKVLRKRARMQGGGWSWGGGGLGDRIVREGWVTKESRHWGRWRLRWLVLHYEPGTGLPVLATYRSASPMWELGLVPRPTEQLRLVGATCYRCPVEDNMSAGRPHAFAVNLRGRDFLFACESAHEMTEWVRAISMSLAELALRLGGVATGMAATDASAAYEPFLPADALAAYGMTPTQPPIASGRLGDLSSGTSSRWREHRAGSSLSPSSSSSACTTHLHPAALQPPLGAAAVPVAAAEAGRVAASHAAADGSAAEELRRGVSLPRAVREAACGGACGGACEALRPAATREAACGSALEPPGPACMRYAESGCADRPAAATREAACGGECACGAPASEVACGSMSYPGPIRAASLADLGPISDPSPDDGASISGISVRSPDDLEAENEALKLYIERLHGSLDAVALQQERAQAPTCGRAGGGGGREGVRRGG